MKCQTYSFVISVFPIILVLPDVVVSFRIPSAHLCPTPAFLCVAASAAACSSRVEKTTSFLGVV